MAAVVFVLLALTVVAGCGSGAMDALNNQKLTVLFGKKSTPKERAHVREACSDVPHTSPVPYDPHSENKVERLYGVKFQIGDARQGDIRKLYTCLHDFDSVIGVKDPSNL